MQTLKATKKFIFEDFEKEEDVFVIKSISWHGQMAHNHNFIEVVYVSRGTGIHCVGNRRYPLSAGDMFIVFPDEVHSLVATGNPDDFQWINCNFKENFVDFDFSVFPRENRYVGVDSFDMKFMFNTMLEEYQGREQGFVNVVRGFLIVILSIMSRHINLKADAENYANVKRRSNVKRAVNYIHKHFKEPIKLEDIAKDLCISVGYLSKIFKEEKQVTPLSYLNKVRINEACRLLIGTKMSVWIIAKDVGFRDRKSFYIQFKNIMDITPAEYRGRH